MAHHHGWLNLDVSQCVARAEASIRAGGFDRIIRESWYVVGSKAGMETYIHCQSNVSGGPTALSIAVAGCGSTGQNQMRDFLRDQMENPSTAGPPNAGAPVVPSAGGGTCGNPTVPNAYLTASVRQPAGWQRPVGIAWQPSITANDCYQKCVSNRDFSCRAFYIENGPAGQQCWISSLDRSGGVTVTPYPPSGKWSMNYWEVRDCQGAPGGGQTALPPTPVPAAPTATPPSAAGSCGNPTVPNAYLTASVRQPAGWQRPVGIPWRPRITPNECYQSCVSDREFTCRAFYIENGPAGQQCWISALDRAGGVTVTPYPPSGKWSMNYWEVRDCQGALGGGQPPSSPPNPVPSTPPSAPPSAGGCSDPRTIDFMDEWLTRAVPVPAGNYRFDQWGRLIGSNQSTTVTNINQPVDPYNWSTRCQYLWSIASSMNSRNLGTMLNYVQGRLAGR